MVSKPNSKKNRRRGWKIILRCFKNKKEQKHMKRLSSTTQFKIDILLPFTGCRSVWKNARQESCFGIFFAHYCASLDFFIFLYFLCNDQLLHINFLTNKFFLLLLRITSLKKPFQASPLCCEPFSWYLWGSFCILWYVPLILGSCTILNYEIFNRNFLYCSQVLIWRITATRLEPTTTQFINEHSTKWLNG